MSPLSKEQFEAIREESKTKIIAVALQLFSKKGFENTSISDIAKAAGISKGLTYNYFKSKDELLEATLLFILRNVVEVLEKGQLLTDPFKRLEFFIRTNFELLKKEPDFWKMFIVLSLQLDKKSKAAKILKDYWGRLFENAINIFKEMGHENYLEMAYQYGAMMDGLSMQYILLNDPSFPFDETLEKVIKQYCTPRK
ncbi:MAG TPA: TetR/AcrR family transcriptional regulator [Bacteroidia bacterium]|nr:TetR/AcrR family transcriptional regulator [Bacteroidia bacterium]